MITEIAHNITHKHMSFRRENIGEFVMCKWRFTNFAKLMFRPDLDGAGWWLVPDEEECWKGMISSASAHEAMAILRSTT